CQGADRIKFLGCGAVANFELYASDGLVKCYFLIGRNIESKTYHSYSLKPIGVFLSHCGASSCSCWWRFLDFSRRSLVTVWCSAGDFRSSACRKFGHSLAVASGHLGVTYCCL